MDSKQLDQIAQFEDRMSAVEKDDPDRALACKRVRNMLVNARHVLESVFNDDVASDVQAVLAVHAAIADELEDIRIEREGTDEDEDE